MLYLINKKTYILVSGYFVEVQVIREKLGKGYNVVPKGTQKIEANTIKKYSTITVEEAYKLMEKE